MIQISLVVLNPDTGMRTTRLTCSGVRGLVGNEPEWVARGGVDGRSAMTDVVVTVFGISGCSIPDPN